MARHAMQIMGRDGHKTVAWDENDKASITSASALFDQLVDKGYRAFRDEGGAGDGPMKKFDPTAGEIVMAVPLVGG